MSDILFGNNNKAIINRLAKNSFIANKRRNLFSIIALILTAFMITSVFSIGFSYFETYKIQQIRTMGTTADAAITNPTEEQIKQLENLSFVSDFGISQRLGSIDTSNMKDALLGIVWLDDKEWQLHRLPTISDVHGNYPVAQNEIMLPTWVLEQMGISSPQIGMSVELSYQLENGQQHIKENFVLSGYYTDYLSTRTNHRGYIYVSTSFREATKLPFTNGGSAMLTFSSDNIKQNCDRLENSLTLTTGQSLEIVPTNEANGSMLIFGLVFTIFLIAFSGYLLIYNVFYISVSKDTHFFGQLKTIGTTKKQIKQIIRKQVLWTSVISIPVGLILGGLFSFWIVPYALNMMYSGNTDTGIKISFSPLVFVGATVFTFLTAFIGSMKPAKIAGSISPIAALRYTGMENIKKESKHKKSGIKLYRMAWENIFRKKKSALLVFASLCFGLFLFLISTGLLSSLSPQNFVNQWGEADFVLTYQMSTEGEPITEEMLSEIQQIESIDDLRLTYSPMSVTTDVEYDETVFGKYIKSLDNKSGIDFSTNEKINAYTQNFYSGIYGIDTRYVQELNQVTAYPIDVKSFENGEILLLTQTFDDDGKNLFKPGEKITIETQNGQHTFTVGESFLEDSFQSGRGHMRGTAPDIFISQNALKELFPNYKIFRVAFNTNGTNDIEILNQLKVITAAHSEIQIISRYEKRIEMNEYIITTRILGIGLSLVLLLIGVINFINTMVVSVNTRRHELAILESIGMTKQQIKKVLLYEGCYYWGISFALVITLGNGIYTLLYFVFRQSVPYAVFIYPLFPLILVAVIVLFICLYVPVSTYKAENKNSIVERLRTME